MKKRRKSGNRVANRTLKIKLLAVALGVLVTVGAVSIVGRMLEGERTTATGSLENRFVDDQTIEYQGKRYAYNQRIDSFLFVGVDKKTTGNRQITTARAGGQSDFLLLLVIDNAVKTYRRIQIDRDTMAEITVLGILGNPLGTSTSQICLAHGYGDGKEQSAQFTVEAVQRLLYGIPITGYVTLNMDGITVFNDLLGGVTVTLEDDLSMLDPEMMLGKTVTLRGSQAEMFVRSRMQVGDGTNAARMRRQAQYMEKALTTIKQRLEQNTAFLGTLFDGLKDYLLTDVARGKLMNEANRAFSYQDLGTLVPAGEHTVGEDGFVEFHVNQDQLLQMVLDVFYQPLD